MLNADEEKMLRDTFARLIERKNTHWPNFRNRIDHVSVQLINGEPVMKARPGIYISTWLCKTPPPKPEPITPDAIRALRKKLALTQAVFAQKFGVSASTVCAWEHGRSRPSEQHASLIRTMLAE